MIDFKIVYQNSLPKLVYDYQEEGKEMYLLIRNI
jgi:hypothetical protein